MKSGREEFFSQILNPDINVLNFWRWLGSNLLVNTTRGVLAEFLVASSLCLAKEPRNNWDSYDIELKPDVRIEVKSAAKYQAWKQRKVSQIEFGIQKRKKWNSKTGKYSDEQTREAHIYVFCVFNKIEPLNLDDWEFYVLLSERINERCGDQSKISLTSLKHKFPELKPFRFDELNNAINVMASDVLVRRGDQLGTS